MELVALCNQSRLKTEPYYFECHQSRLKVETHKSRRIGVLRNLDRAGDSRPAAPGSNLGSALLRWGRNYDVRLVPTKAARVPITLFRAETLF